LKYEEVYLKTYESVKEARRCIGDYINWYNTKRRHSGLNYKRPIDVMMGLEQATSWAFLQPNRKLKKAYGNVENATAFTHTSIGTTTNNNFLNKKEDLGVATLSVN
jgi:hypothetical protein